MPFPDPIFQIALVALIASGIAFWGFNFLSSISSKIRWGHTGFTMTQIEGELGKIEVADFPTDMTELIAVLSSSKIDWNSCEIGDDRILDGWGRPISTTFDERRMIWTFHSSGKDGEIGTEDDLRNVAVPIKRGEQ